MSKQRNHPGGQAAVLLFSRSVSLSLRHQPSDVDRLLSSGEAALCCQSERSGASQPAAAVASPSVPPSVRPSLRSAAATRHLVSVSVALKSAAVDAEDSDRVVGAGTGELQPGAFLLLPLFFLLVFIAPPRLTCATRTRPPAQPLHCQTVALSVEGYALKEKNETNLKTYVLNHAAYIELHSVVRKTVEQVTSLCLHSSELFPLLQAVSNGFTGRSFSSLHIADESDYNWTRES